MSDTPKFSEFLKSLYRIWITERPNQLAAGLAYFGMFSFAPIIVIAFAVADLFIDAVSLRDRIFGRIEEALGAEVSAFVKELVGAVEQPSDAGSILLAIVGFLALLFAASSFFFQLQFALNTIWKVPPLKEGQTRAFLTQRLWSFVMVLVLGILLVALALFNLIAGWLGSIFDLGLLDGRLGLLVFVILTALVFAVLYKVLPDTDVSWRSVWLGAGTAAVLITLGGVLAAWLLGLGRLNSGVAAAGAFVVVLLLIYFIAQIFLFGAIISREYAAWYEQREVVH